MATGPIDDHVGYIQILLYQQSFNEDVHAYICEHHKLDAREIFINLEKNNIFLVPEYILPKSYLKKKEKKEKDLTTTFLALYLNILLMTS